MNPFPPTSYVNRGTGQGFQRMNRLSHPYMSGQGYPGQMQRPIQSLPLGYPHGLDGRGYFPPFYQPPAWDTQEVPVEVSYPQDQYPYSRYQLANPAQQTVFSPLFFVEQEDDPRIPPRWKNKIREEVSVEEEWQRRFQALEQKIERLSEVHKDPVSVPVTESAGKKNKKVTNKSSTNNPWMYATIVLSVVILLLLFFIVFLLVKNSQTQHTHPFFFPTFIPHPTDSSNMVTLSP